LWHDGTGRPADFEQEEVPARLEILQRGFDAQLSAVTRALHRVARSSRNTRDTSAASIRRGLLALLSHFPVYRTYDAGLRRSPTDETAFAKALAAAKQATPESAHPVLDRLDRWLGGEPGDETANTRFQQLSAPVAAKAVEDTAFYRYGRLLSRNDVGFDAARLGSSAAEFHRACAARLESFPNAMLATATHDHKRGEDLRARLAVISEVPDDWAAFLARCRARETAGPDEGARPDPGDEIMLYQMIVGAWPLDLEPGDTDGCRVFAERLAAWQEKALREAKLRTDWTSPNAAYEATARDFLFSLFEPGGDFLRIAHSFVNSIAPAGAVNGLSQTVLKLTVPGMPDFFQGTEFWDFTLVDPDNRRAVDYAARLDALRTTTEPPAYLTSWRDGRIKQSVVHRLLNLRRRMPDLFAGGEYSPVCVEGPMRDHIVAFTRGLGGAAILVVVPRLAQSLLRAGDHITLDPNRLGEGKLALPRQLQDVRFYPVLCKHRSEPSLEMLADFPVAVFSSVDFA
jgi:(1->4)-alpha-D-glucan 1-alpha-D-glucosylmutase